MRLAILIFIFVLLDLYIFQIVKVQVSEYSDLTKRIFYIFYWVFSLVILSLIPWIPTLDPFIQRELRTLAISLVAITVFTKLILALFLVIDDLWRGIQWLIGNFSKPPKDEIDLGRSKFLMKSAVITASVPAATLSFGIATGAYDYRVRRRTISFPNLPSEFDGIRMVQLSDIHSGSFYNKTAVKGGVEMVLNEKPDIICFTGDLVNDQSKEVEDYISVFEKLKAPLGVYSIMGNHDYGDYRNWSSAQAKNNDVRKLQEAHRLMGWDILLNENRNIKVDGAEIGLLGVENWGKGRFSKYGDLAKTMEGTQELPFNVLLSHDPSHWEAQVIPESNIDLTLSGHTHGFQFGIEIGDFRWSPSQYLYKQWADLYEKKGQYIYVNRGFGFIGYPGRVGILPEITVLTLKKT